jgi:hypothetical protein
MTPNRSIMTPNRSNLIYKDGQMIDFPHSL